MKRNHLLHPKNDSFGILKVFLRILNRDKTELLVLNILITVRAPTGCLLQYQLVSNEVISPSSSARNTGILFHSNMSMEPLFTAVAKSAFYHLRNIPVSRIRKYISFHTTEILMHALVTSRLDFCHSLLYGIPQNVLKKLQ